MKEIGEAGAKVLGSFRETVQDLLVPELRAIKVQIEALTQEMRLRKEQLAQEMRLRDEQQKKAIDQLSNEMKLRDEQQKKAIDQLSGEMRLRDERQTKAIGQLSEKLDFSLEFRDRLSQLEARLPKQ